MLKIFRNKKAQNTAEYAILIALVVGGVIAMQTYAQRTLQARLRDASVMLRNETSQIGNTLQYEPYYTNTSAIMDKENTSVDTFYNQSQDNLSYKRTGSLDRTEYNTGAVQATGFGTEAGF